MSHSSNSNEDSGEHSSDTTTFTSTDDLSSSYSHSESESNFITHVISKYGFNENGEDDDNDESIENLFETVYEEWNTNHKVSFDDPHEILKTIPIAYLYSYYDTIQETLRDIFGNNLDNSRCIQMLDEKYIDHDSIMMDFGNLDENLYLVGSVHSFENSSEESNNDNNTTFCVGLTIQDEEDIVHSECSCGNYGEMKYILSPIYIDLCS